MFETDGCGSSIACASFAAEMARGKTPDQILEICGESILQELGGLPEDQQHCISTQRRPLKRPFTTT